MATVAVPTAQQVVNSLAGGQELNAAPTTLNGGNFWVGSDGNVYVKSAGVTGANGAAADNLGKNNPALTTDLKSYGATGITDPNAPAPGATGGGGSGGSSTTSGGGVLSQDVINGVLQSIANSVSGYNSTYQTDLGTNNANQANGDSQYNTSGTDNTEARAQSIQQAEQAGAQGLKGLDAVLASLGGLSGTGSLLAGRAVASTTNNDIGSANQTFTTNKQAIDNAKGAYDTQYNQDDANLKNALDTDTKNANATGYQELLDQANSIGDTSLYQKYLPLAVANTAPTTPLAPTVIPVAQATTASYGANSPLTVKAAPSTASIAPAAGLTPTNSALSITKDNS